MSNTPSSRPKIAREDAERIVRGFGIRTPVALVGIRGYYLHTMGDPERNDVGIYDDAILLVAPTTYATFNANTDPSRQTPGIATLVPGVWMYRVGIHGLSKPKPRRYTALVQAEAVKVRRLGRGDDTGFFGINIHRGGWSGTSSLGCQTIHPAQWPEFIRTVTAALRAAAQPILPYVLVEDYRP